MEINLLEIEKELEKTYGVPFTVKVRDNKVINEIILAVCQVFDVPVVEFFDKSKDRPKSDARKIAMVMMRDRTNMTVEKIAEMFGRHHTTVLHALASYRELMESRDFDFVENVRLCEERTSYKISR